MKKILLMAVTLFCLFPVSMASALGVWVDEEQWSEYGDFIVINNTPYSLRLENYDGNWGHVEIFNGGDMQPYSIRVDADCSLKGNGTNSGSMYAEILVRNVSWVIYILAHTEKSENQTYWTMGQNLSNPYPGDIPDNDQTYAKWHATPDIVATFMVRTANDTTSFNWTGNTKIILTFTDLSNTTYNAYGPDSDFPWYSNTD